MFNFILKMQVKMFVFISRKKQVKMFPFISWLVSFEVCIQIQYFCDVVRNKLQTINIINCCQVLQVYKYYRMLQENPWPQTYCNDNMNYYYSVLFWFFRFHAFICDVMSTDELIDLWWVNRDFRILYSVFETNKRVTFYC